MNKKKGRRQRLKKKFEEKEVLDKQLAKKEIIKVTKETEERAY